jgi:hypothetical protein
MAIWKHQVLGTLLSLASAELIVGCRNAPGDLALRAEPDQPVFAPSEPIRLRVTLTANEGPVCFDRDAHFEVELTHAESAAVQRGCEAFGRCGMPYIPLFPLMLALAAGERLDVADCLGRFAVLPRGGARVYDLKVVPRAKGIRVVNTSLGLHTERVLPSGAFPPGHYHLRCKLTRQNSFLPLFWTRYDQPLAGETEFDVASESHD